MGRSYWFECPRCGYRAKVSGRTDRGLNLFVQTIACQDCKELYDAVTGIRVPGDSGAVRESNHQKRSLVDNLKRPPTFLSAVNRLTLMGGPQSKWLQFPAQCPVASFHRIKPWTDPGKCPRCGIYLEKNVLPYRIWE